MRNSEEMRFVTLADLVTSTYCALEADGPLFRKTHRGPRHLAWTVRSDLDPAARYYFQLKYGYVLGESHSEGLQLSMGQTEALGRL